MHELDEASSNHDKAAGDYCPATKWVDDAASTFDFEYDRHYEHDVLDFHDLDSVDDDGVVDFVYLLHHEHDALEFHDVEHVDVDDVDDSEHDQHHENDVLDYHDVGNKADTAA